METELGFYKKLANTTKPGVCHADDVGYLFKISMSPQIKEGSLEDKSMRRVITLWTNFAKYSNPNPIKKDPLIQVTWHPAKQGEHHFLDIGEDLLTGVNPDGDRMAFWDEIYRLANVKHL